MKIIKIPLVMSQFVNESRNQSIGFVPTMGALHEGHFSLIKKAKKETDLTVVSIYVNETQFNDPEDLKNYPNRINEDLANLKKLNVDAVFTPRSSDIYPDGFRYRVSENQQSLELCGQDRPGHFDGVLTVLMKLLNIVKPNKAYFGEKDYQQLQLVRGMVENFFMNIDVVGVPTERDERGLALSSRNLMLSVDDMEKAHFFAKKIKTHLNLSELRQELSQNGIDVDYLVEKQGRRYAAVKISNVRLIDNVEI